MANLQSKVLWSRHTHFARTLGRVLAVQHETALWIGSGGWMTAGYCSIDVGPRWKETAQAQGSESTALFELQPKLKLM